MLTIARWKSESNCLVSGTIVPLTVVKMEQVFHICPMIDNLDPRYGSLIFDNIPHGIFTVDADGRVTSFNSAAESITGWLRKEVIGRPCRDVFQSVDRS